MQRVSWFLERRDQSIPLQLLPTQFKSTPFFLPDPLHHKQQWAVKGCKHRVCISKKGPFVWPTPAKHLTIGLFIPGIFNSRSESLPVYSNWMTSKMSTGFTIHLIVLTTTFCLLNVSCELFFRTASVLRWCKSLRPKKLIQFFWSFLFPGDQTSVSRGNGLNQTSGSRPSGDRSAQQTVLYGMYETSGSTQKYQKAADMKCQTVLMIVWYSLFTTLSLCVPQSQCCDLITFRRIIQFPYPHPFSFTCFPLGWILI